MQAFWSKIVTTVQFGVMGFMLMADQVFPGLLSNELREKKMMIVMGAWFVGNTLNNALTSTGAFEVLFDGKVVFSKLALGRMPSSMDEIMRGITKAMQDGVHHVE